VTKNSGSFECKGQTNSWLASGFLDRSTTGILPSVAEPAHDNSVRIPLRARRIACRSRVGYCAMALSSMPKLPRARVPR